MSLKTRILNDMKTAMKTRDSEKLSVLRMVKANIMNKEIDKGGDLSDEEITKALNTLVKQRRDSATQYEKADRSELAEKEHSEIVIIEDYLPRAASAEELDKAIADAITETKAGSMKDMGNVMQATLEKLAGKRADGKAVSEKVRQKLS